MERNYTILDNAGQEITEFDIVAIADNKSGVPENEFGVVFGTIILTLSNFENIDDRNNRVTAKKNTIFNTGRMTSIANRVEVEVGRLPGTYKMKGIIKISTPDENMMDFRVKIIDLMDKGFVTSNVPRKLVNEFLDAAKWEGYM